VTGFGRKGIGQESSHPVEPAPRSDLSGLDALRNGNRGSMQARPIELSDRAAAFVASERSRGAEGAARNGGSASEESYLRSIRPERSLLMAFLLWFILGQVSAHRFYLGAYRSAMIQVGLFVLWFGLALSSPMESYDTVGPVVMILIAVWAIWIIGDVFFIRSIHRRLCRQPGEYSSVFA
jgi:hypothetical protein